MRSPALLALCLLVWTPTVSSAQPADDAAPASDAPTLPPLITAPEEPETPAQGENLPQSLVTEEEASEFLVPRLMLSPIVGGVATAGGAMLGLLLAIGVGGCIPGEGCDDWALAVPMMMGGWAAGSLSVYGMGSLLNGRGRLGPTMIGGALGLALSTTFIAVTEEGDLWYAAALGPPIGALIGYELFTSHERSQREQDEEAYAGLQLMPVVGRLPKGGILGGLVGRF